MLTDQNEMSSHHRGPSIDASFLVSVHSEEKIFRNRSIRNKNCLLMDRDEMSNHYRGPPIGASYQVSVHLVKQFQGRRFLEIDQSETIIVCGGHVC